MSTRLNGNDEVRREMLARFARLASEPVVVVHGVVEASGVGGMRLTPTEDWVLKLTLVAWRIGAGPIRTEPLTLLAKTDFKMIGVVQSRAKPDDLIACRVRLGPQVEDEHQAVLVDFDFELSTDVELTELRQESIEPVIRDLADLGSFTLNRAVNWYEGSTRWRDRDSRLVLVGVEQVDAVAYVAREVVRSLESFVQSAIEYSVKALLEVKNSGWLEPDELPISAEEFREALILNAIHVWSSGALSLEFDDGDLFWGHPIQVNGTLSAGWSEASI